MKKQTTFLVLATFLFSMACQLLTPSTRDGTVISVCVDVVRDFREVQPGAIPQSLLETGIKQGGEFDVNDYFDAFTHISMEEGYALDYVYQLDSLGSFPILYARPADQPVYASIKDVPADMQASNYLDYISIDDSEQGYFEFVALDIMARQFYLDWHANYNDTELVCDKKAVNAIIADINNGSFGAPFNASQQLQARALTDIEPLVKLTDDSAVVEIITFTKWGGFYRLTYTINPSFPHTILDVKTENILKYDCGVVF